MGSMLKFINFEFIWKDIKHFDFKQFLGSLLNFVIYFCYLQHVNVYRGFLHIFLMEICFLRDVISYSRFEKIVVHVFSANVFLV